MSKCIVRTCLAASHMVWYKLGVDDNSGTKFPKIKDKSTKETQLEIKKQNMYTTYISRALTYIFTTSFCIYLILQYQYSSKLSMSYGESSHFPEGKKGNIITRLS